MKCWMKRLYDDYDTQLETHVEIHGEIQSNTKLKEKVVWRLRRAGGSGTPHWEQPSLLARL